MSASPYDTPAPPSGGEEVVPPVGKKPRNMGQMNRATIALIALFLGGAAMIYGLSLRKGPAEASAELQTAEAQVDSAILRLSTAPPKDPSEPMAGRVTRELLKNFCSQVKERQIPAQALQKDPFVFVPPPPRLGTTISPRLAREAVVRTGPRQESLAEATRRFNGFNLQSIMMSPRGGGTAIISNNLLTAGQSIAGFTVKSIQPKAVVLTWKDKEFTLEMPFQE